MRVRAAGTVVAAMLSVVGCGGDGGAERCVEIGVEGESIDLLRAGRAGGRYLLTWRRTDVDPEVAPTFWRASAPDTGFEPVETTEMPEGRLVPGPTSYLLIGEGPIAIVEPDGEVRQTTTELARPATAVAPAGDGWLLVGRDGGSQTLWLTRLDADGTPIDESDLGIAVADGQSAALAPVGAIFWLAYQDGDDVSAVRLQPDGTVVDPEPVTLETYAQLHALAGNGDRGLAVIAFGDSGFVRRVVVDEAGVVSTAILDGVPPGRLAAFPGRGYLLGGEWLDLDGAIVEDAYEPAVYGELAVGGDTAIVAAIVEDEPTAEQLIGWALDVWTLEFGGATSGPVQVDHAAEVEVEHPAPCID